VESLFFFLFILEILRKEKWVLLISFPTLVYVVSLLAGVGFFTVPQRWHCYNIWGKNKCVSKARRGLPFAKKRHVRSIQVLFSSSSKHGIAADVTGEGVAV